VHLVIIIVRRKLHTHDWLLTLIDIVIPDIEYDFLFCICKCNNFSSVQSIRSLTVLVFLRFPMSNILGVCKASTKFDPFTSLLVWWKGSLNNDDFYLPVCRVVLPDIWRPTCADCGLSVYGRWSAGIFLILRPTPDGFRPIRYGRGCRSLLLGVAAYRLDRSGRHTFYLHAWC